MPALPAHHRARHGPLYAVLLDVRDYVTAGAVVSYLNALFTVCGVLAVGLPICLWQIHRAWKAEAGPDDLWLPQDLDEHLDEYVAADPDLWEVFGVGGSWGVPDPDHTTDHTTEGES